MSDKSNGKKSSLVEFSRAIGVVLGVPIALFTIINNIVQQTAISLVVAVLTGIVLAVWLAYSRKMNLAYLAIAWLLLVVIVLLGFAVWPNTMIIEGFVSDSNGEPVTNETVKFFDYRGQVYETQTDKDGFYQFMDVPTGKYKIRVRTTEIQGESKGLLVRVVSQSIAVSSDSGEIVDVVPTDTPVLEKPEDVPINDITDIPTPKPTNTPTKLPTNTPKPTSTSTPFPTPDIPIFDDFEDGIVKSSWYDPKWEEEHNLEFEFVENNGTLQLQAKNATNIDRWGKFLLGNDYELHKVYALMTLESVKNGRIGLYVGTPSNWYDLFIQRDVIFLGSSQGTKKTTINHNCCPSTHLLGMETDGQEIYFYVDGKLLTSLPERGAITNSGFEIVADKGGGEVITSISNVWAQ